ncbi:MAG: hypothetical protein C5B51_01590 [Terriglobia bacterium]|nr:MAG: hypothetical protein C5B51_01590 [Terriglobia bacterium]
MKPRNTLTRSLPRNSPSSLKPTKPAIPKGALFLGVFDGQHVYLTTRDRSLHLVLIGATGSGKTTAQEFFIRQDVSSRNGFSMLDPMGSLYDRLLRFLCYRKAIGCRVPEAFLFNASEPDWVLPINPFQRRDGDISVQVDRRVAGTLHVWGQHRGDYTPRLEKYLKIVFHAVIECGLTIVEAGWLIDRYSGQLREHVIKGLSEPLIRSKFEQLSAYKPSEFLEQTESLENRLMRFLVSGTIRRIMGIGQNALDFAELLDKGQALLCNLAISKHLSREQRRLIGTLFLNEYFETALERKSGSRPHYLYVDEAAEFVTPQMGEALETCRQKGLHFILSFQHLSQFKAGHDERLYKAIKNNARNKIVFAVPDRQDAQELSDDLFEGLAEPQVKFVHRHLNHFLEDVRETSQTRGTSTSQSEGQNHSASSSLSRSSGASLSLSISRGNSLEYGRSRSRTFSRSKTLEQGTSESHSQSSNESHTSGFNESHSRQENSSSNSSETMHERHEDGFFEWEASGRSQSRGQSSSSSEGYSRTETGSDTYQSGSSDTSSSSESKGSTRQLSWSKARQRSFGQNWSSSWSGQKSNSEAAGLGESIGQSSEQASSRSESLTNQPGVHHHAFWEEDPEFWKLEEQRWKAAELLMYQKVGECFMRTEAGLYHGRLPLPKKFFVLPKTLERLTRALYEAHCLPKAEAEQLVAARERQLIARPGGGSGARTPAPDRPASPAVRSSEQPIWNRAALPGTPPLTSTTASTAGKRGPKADASTHTAVAAVLAEFGPDWASGQKLLEVCQRLDEAGVPTPKAWLSRPEGRSLSWRRAVSNYPDLVKKIIRYYLKASGHSS